MTRAGLLVAVLLVACRSPSYYDLAHEHLIYDERAVIPHHYDQHHSLDLAILEAVCAELRGDYYAMGAVYAWCMSTNDECEGEDFAFAVQHYRENIGTEWFCTERGSGRPRRPGRLR